jgi:acetyl-CoA synthetase
MGKAAPGHHVAIIDPSGQPVPTGSEGDIAVLRPDPVMFLYYWNDPSATAAKFRGDYLLTGDRGVMDDESYIFFVGRDDDVITSAGYRIGPGPIEDGLLSHEAVSMAAVVGLADAERTEIVTAFIVLKEGFKANEALKKSLQDHVRTRVAAHEYPRQIHFLDELPMTTTGKIIRKELKKLAL